MFAVGLLAAAMVPAGPRIHLAAVAPSLCAPATITSVADSAGEHFGTPGQTVVKVSGAGFSALACSASVTVGSATVDAQHVTVDPTGTSLTFTLPSGPGGSVTVVMTDSVGNGSSSNGNFHFYALPTAVVANALPVENSTVAVSGSNFTFGGAVTTPPTATVCDGSVPSMMPAVTVSNDVQLSFPAPSVYCAGPVQLTFRAPYDSNAAAAGADTPVTMIVPAGFIDVAAHVSGISTTGPILPGNAVVVSGSGFGPGGTATLNGQDAAVHWSDHVVSVTIPTTATTGPLTLVRSADDAALTSVDVTVGSTITAVSPPQGSVGDRVQITGSGFGPATGAVQIGGVPAPVGSWSATQISVTVPDGAATGQLTVIPTVNLPPGAVTFQVVPTIVSLTPSTGGSGTVVVIHGTSFGSGTGHVTVGGRASAITLWSDHVIVIVVPDGLTDGLLPVTVVTADPGSQSVSATAFTFASALAPPPGAQPGAQPAAQAGGSPGIIVPNKNGKPVATTGPVPFHPPPQNGPVVIAVEVTTFAPPGSAIPYTVTVTAFGGAVSGLRVNVVIALEPATDASITTGTTTTDGAGQVHGFLHLSRTPGVTLLLATSGPYRNEVEITTRGVTTSSIGGAPFFVTATSGAGALGLLSILGLVVLALLMSRGRSPAVAGFSASPLPRRWTLRNVARVSLPRQRAGGHLRGPTSAAVRYLAAWWARNRLGVLRRAGIAGGIGLIAVYLLASISTLTALPLALGFGSSAVVPEGSLYNVASVLVSLALTAIAVRYVYYYRCWAVSRHFFTHPVVPDAGILAARSLPNMKIQITTKGGALPVVERSLVELERIVGRNEWLQSTITAEVITEIAEEAEYLESRFAGSSLPVTGVQLPADYQTPNGTKLKARALQYMVEKRRAGWNHRDGLTFIVHFDEETLVTESHLLVLIDYLSGAPRPVSQGPIVYPLEWSKTPWICRALESTRPFGCSECARVMENPPPPHLHGSNLVVEEQAENAIGWDFGTLEGQPFIAEDLLFGLRAFSVLGRDAFGWHGATMLEQPPLSLHWAIQQRLRWVTGALQGLRAMTTRPEYDGISRTEKRRLFGSIAFRIGTYSLGFPVGFAGLYFLVHPVTTSEQWGSLFGLWRGLIIFSAVAWVVSYQIGMARNLRYQAVSRRTRIQHSLVMLVMTPVAGLCETVGPFIALLRWMFGARRASWTPTPKLSERRLRPDSSTVVSAGAEIPEVRGPA